MRSRPLCQPPPHSTHHTELFQIDVLLRVEVACQQHPPRPVYDGAAHVRPHPAHPRTGHNASGRVQLGVGGDGLRVTVHTTHHGARERRLAHPTEARRGIGCEERRRQRHGQVRPHHRCEKAEQEQLVASRLRQHNWLQPVARANLVPKDVEEEAEENPTVAQRIRPTTGQHLQRVPRRVAPLNDV